MYVFSDCIAIHMRKFKQILQFSCFLRLQKFYKNKLSDLKTESMYKLLVSSTCENTILLKLFISKYFSYTVSYFATYMYNNNMLHN